MDTAAHPVILTERQRRLLWLVSMGYTRSGIALSTGWDPANVKSISQRVRRTLSASTDAQAVRTGLLDGHIGPYADCGHRTAYRRHIQADEPICPCCKRGNRDRMETEALLRGRPQLAEPHIRLLRAFHAGRSDLQIRQAWRIDERTLTQLIHSTYELLGVDRMPASLRREAALSEAERRGMLAAVPDVPVEACRPPVRLSQTQVRILTELENGASISEAAGRLDMPRGTCASRLSEVYQTLDVAWADKAERLSRAVRRARELGLLPERTAT